MATSISIFKPEAGVDAIMPDKNNHPVNRDHYAAIGKTRCLVTP
jgi:hypothetical protein